MSNNPIPVLSVLKRTIMGNNANSKPVVLIVDDDAEVRGLIASIIRPHAEVIARSTVNEAMEAISRSDILILDWNLNGNDLGEIVLGAWIVANGGPVCIISGSMPIEELDDLFTRGARNVIAKPFSPVKILNIVLYYIRNVTVAKEVKFLRKEVGQLRILVFALLAVVGGVNGVPELMRLFQ